MKRIEFTILGEGGDTLREPGFVDACSDLPLAIMQAVEDFLDANNGEIHLPMTIQVRPSAVESTC